MSHLTTLLVHPDAAIRARLRAMLEPVSFVRVLGEAATGQEAQLLLDAIPYGVFFLGVSLSSPTDGLDLARLLLGRRQRPALVFLATDEQHAFAAFELEATDYLIFPCQEDRFARTVDRLRQFKTHHNLAPEPSSRWREPHAPVQVEHDGDYDELEETVQLPLADDEQEDFLSALKQAWDHSSRFRPVEIERLAITLEGKTMLLPYHEIIFVEAYEDYSYVHTATQKYLTSYRLKVLESRLRAHRFFRVHRKYLVNLDMVTEIASLPGSNFMLRTAGRTRIELPISRRRLAELKQVLGL
ncbi:LytR/AlgR family response regulator transcription factor [Desulfovibrio psychrotolerans]|uniref:Transcriptional regulator n=1 Tax=Desulfovibrio psychrotolerans TaxID=415242 RepID=A0A7J0BWR4_9BACT|nr:LytTR family DNA-binding domain-containing protein [Desulfovibrio psychrotolerans]GFM37602.1 transcriptional regulator [Desulfovibrio psychrotolerans]